MVDLFFQLFCVVIMWPMLFSVPVLYASNSTDDHISDTLTFTSIGYFIALVAWVVVGYVLSFEMGDFANYFHQVQSGDGVLLVAISVQACFFLYSVGMFVGTLIHKVKAPFLAIFIPLWMLSVYVPAAYLLWNDQGWLANHGALDFSGGLVVHLTAGITSLVLSWYFRHSHEPDVDRTSDLGPNYLATTLVAFGWFGFNLAPLETVSDSLGLVLMNTILTIVAASTGFMVIHRKHPSADDIFSGVMVGLVISTTIVGYASPLEMFAVSLIGSMAVATLNDQIRLNDPVDSFVLNGLGGLAGAIGSIFVVNPDFSAGQAGLLHGIGNLHFPLIQLGAIFAIALIAFIGSYLSLTLTKLLYFRKKA